MLSGLVEKGDHGQQSASAGLTLLAVALEGYRGLEEPEGPLEGPRAALEWADVLKGFTDVGGVHDWIDSGGFERVGGAMGEWAVGGTPESRTEKARHIFLHGTIDGRKLNVPDLAKETGLSETTVRRYIPGWVEEHEKLVITANHPDLLTCLSSKIIEQFHRDTDFLRSQITDIQREIKNCDILAEKFERLIFTDTKNQKLADRFFKAVHTKAKLRAQLIPLEKQWMHMSGLEGKLSAMTTVETERAKEKVRLERESDAPRPAKGKTVAGGLWELPG